MFVSAALSVIKIILSRPSRVSLLVDSIDDNMFFATS